LKKSNIVNIHEEIEEITVSMDESELNSSLCVLVEGNIILIKLILIIYVCMMYVCILDINSGTPSTKPNNTAESNLPNSKRMLNLRVGKVLKNINY